MEKMVRVASTQDGAASLHPVSGRDPADARDGVGGGVEGWSERDDSSRVG